MRATPTAAVALLLALSATVAHAADPPPRHEPSAGDLTTARNALREGLAQRENGDAAGALTRLSTAWDLVQTPITGFELAKTHMILGHVLTARELFFKVVRLPASLEESPRSAAAREEAARLAKELEPRVPSLRIKLTLPPQASATVRIDDDTITMSGNERIAFVDPGPHDVVAKAGEGPEQTVHVEVAEAEVKDVALAPQWVAPKPQPATGPGGQVLFVKTTNPITFIGFGVAAGGLVLATVSAIIMFNANDTLNEICGRSYCPPRDRAIELDIPSRDTFVFDDRYDSAFTRFQVSRVLFIAGAVTTVLFGAVGVVFSQRPVKERVVAGIRPRLMPLFSPSGGGLGGTF